MTVFLSFLNSLRKGNYGLSKTYWKLGVLVKLVILTLMFLSMLFLPVVTPVIYGFYLLYVPFYLSGMFNASINYNNGIIWKILGLISATIGSYIYVREWTQIMDTLSLFKSLM